MRIVILGAGHAGGMAAAMLRQFGHAGPIVLVGDEAAPPYQRPALSKGYFKGELAEERLYLKPAAYYGQQGIELRLGIRVLAVDRASRTVSLSDGATLEYDKLIFATGSRARSLTMEGAGLDGVSTLRTLADATSLRERVRPNAHLVVAGGGYIGLETAAVARELQLQVTVIESGERLLARVAGPLISDFFAEQHRARGVDLRLASTVAALHGEGGRLTGVSLSNGDTLAADMMLVGIGAAANDDLAKEAGLACDDGIVVDADARSSDPDVYAIGDCARRPLPHYGRSGRLESVHNAVEQARLAACALLGKPRPICDAPWFWSDQYDLKLQTVGLCNGYDQAVLRGDPASRKFAVYYLKDRTLLAVDAVNSPGDFMAGKKLVAARAVLDPATLASPVVDG